MGIPFVYTLMRTGKWGGGMYQNVTPLQNVQMEVIVKSQM